MAKKDGQLAVDQPGDITAGDDQFEQVKDWFGAMGLTVDPEMLSSYRSEVGLDAPWTTELVMEHFDLVSQFATRYVSSATLVVDGQAAIDGGATPVNPEGFGADQFDAIVEGFTIARDEAVESLARRIQPLIDEIPDLVSQRISVSGGVHSLLGARGEGSPESGEEIQGGTFRAIDPQGFGRTLVRKVLGVQ